MIEDRLISIKKFYRRFRRLPSYSEMLKIFDISSKNAVFKIINKLIDLGFIKKDNKKLSPTKKFFALPLLGVIKAGFPILAEENKDYLTIDDYLIENPQVSFLLKVSGDSMTGVGIFEGDIVIVERKKDVNIGSIVLAQIDNEWTLKILKTDRKKHINYLEAANPKYPPFYPRNDLQIYGIVRGVIRKIN
jgi:repressor LexA